MQHTMSGGSGGFVVMSVMGQTEGVPSVSPAPAPAGATQIVPAGAPGAAPTTLTPGSPNAPAGSAPAPGGSMMSMMLPILLVFVVMIFLTSMTGRRERKKRAELMSSLKKHDKVQTMGGVIGTIAEINDHEVVLRLEEGRMRVSRAAIQTVLSEGKGSKANGVIEDKDRRPERVEA